MSTATTTPDLDALRREGHARLDELHARRRRLALDALKDPNGEAAAEVARIESEIEAVGRGLRNIGLAEEEQERVESEAEREANEERRAKALREAADLQAQKREAAARVDEAALPFAQALTSFAKATADLNLALMRAGENTLVDLATGPEHALRFAMREASTPLGMIEFSGMTLRTQPRRLAETVPPIPGEGPA